jgi:serine/threonine protein kinase
VYQDLKPENILVFDDGYIKLADFGIIRQTKESHFYMKAETLCYYAPEMVFGI